MASRNGRIQRWARSLRASRMPSGKPMARQNASEVSTSESVTMASGQMPSMATSSKDTAAPMATPRPAHCQASKLKMATIHSGGTLCSKPSIWVSTPSMGPRTVWKKGRKFVTTQSSPWLIQDSTGKLPSHSWCSAKPGSAPSTPVVASRGAVGAAPIQSPPASGVATVSPQGLSGAAVLAASGVAHGLSAAWAAWPDCSGAASAVMGA